MAIGGSIHPIAEAPLKCGERFGDVALSPGRDWLWENGYWCHETEQWYRRDHEPLDPEFWSPLPGDTYKLNEGS